MYWPSRYSAQSTVPSSQVILQKLKSRHPEKHSAGIPQVEHTPGNQVVICGLGTETAVVDVYRRRSACPPRPRSS